MKNATDAVDTISFPKVQMNVLAWNSPALTTACRRIREQQWRHNSAATPTQISSADSELIGKEKY